MAKEKRYDKHVVVPGSTKAPMPGSNWLKKSRRSDTVAVTLYLKPHESHARAAGPAIGPDPGALDAVRAFAAHFGLRVVAGNAAPRVVDLTGSVEQVSRAFNVELHDYEAEGGTFRGRTGPIYVPEEIHPYVKAVLGLDTRPQAHTRFRVRVDQGGAWHPRAAGTSFTPRELAARYAFPSDVAGEGQCIGIIELGGGFDPKELATYFHGLGIAQPPQVAAVPVGGGSNAPTGKPDGPDGEVMLDIEVAGAIAAGARIAVYFAPNTDRGFLLAVTAATHDATNKPTIISISWGGPESSWTEQALDALNDALSEAASAGISVTVAAGDGGASDGVAGTAAHADFPASSPFVLACGGTSIRGSIGSDEETVWNDGPNGGAGGGGVSDYFDVPDWQKSAGVPPSVNPGKRVGRGIPDVAGDADPATGYAVLVDGQATTVGGTSAVAPLWAALIALLNARLHTNVGFLNPKLYQLALSDPSVFHDVTGGSNDMTGSVGGYYAGAGWDACTGWGTPVGANLLAALTPGARPAPGAARPLFDEPVFAEGKPSPDPTGFSYPDDSSSLYTATVDKLLRKQVVGFNPSRGAPSDLFSVAAAWGPQGPGVADHVSRYRQVVFHAIGDSGASQTKYYPGELSVADALTQELQNAEDKDRALFLFHLGDVVYEFGESEYYYDQFYEPLRDYAAPIFAIPGNHDSFVLPGTPSERAPLAVFARNFCSATPIVTPEAGSLHRTAVTQPGVYFALEASPYVRIVGLFSNALEDPGLISSESGRWQGVPDVQLAFLDAQLKRVKSDGFGGALILAVHHPPFSYSPNESGASGRSSGATHGGSPAMLKEIDAVCAENGVYPHAVLSGHAHNYQRFTRTMSFSGTGNQGAKRISVPFIVCGNGGHHVNALYRPHKGQQYDEPQDGIDVSYLDETAKNGTRLTLDGHDDRHYGYLRVTATATKLILDYHPVDRTNTASLKEDRVTVDLDSRSVS